MGRYDNPMPVPQSGIYEFGYCLKWQPDVLTFELDKTVEYECELNIYWYVYSQSYAHEGSYKIETMERGKYKVLKVLYLLLIFFSQIYVHLLYIR